jgi:hypothetical protein
MPLDEDLRHLSGALTDSARPGGEIARMRFPYEGRLPAHLRRATDHFYAELVRTLADRDPPLLGLTT